MTAPRKLRLGGLAALVGLTLIATGCGSDDSSVSAAAETSPAKTTGTEKGRVAVSYEGGIAVLDATSLEIVEQFETEEFTRLNAAGDGKHVFVTTSKGFQLLDTVTPALTGLTSEATTAGHVVRHAGNTVLFDDGTGKTSILKTDELAAATDALPEAQTYTAEKPHHGVSIVLEDGTLVTTVGDETTRTGASLSRPTARTGKNWPPAPSAQASTARAPRPTRP